MRLFVRLSLFAAFACSVSVDLGGGDASSPFYPLAGMTNVTVKVREDSVGIDFDPVDDAVDYRVYPLPKAADVTTNADGSITIKNAIYRCSGLRQTYDLRNNTSTDPNLAPVPTGWDATVSQNPTLGYVYTTAGAGRVPVYAVAGLGTGYFDEQWRESRLKIYTSDSAERQKLLAQTWRDDGVVFFVPQSPSSNTHTVYGLQQSLSQAGVPYVKQSYFMGENAPDAGTSMGTPAFEVLNTQEPETEPLSVVTYNNGNPHDELAAGKERFKRAANQGNGPMWHLEWLGIEQPTTLVIEALASGCPYQGLLASTHVEAPPHQTFFTLGDLQGASPTGEVFINGQYDTTQFPRAIARSVVQVTPAPHLVTDWDWYEGFDGSGSVTPTADLAWPGTFHSIRKQTSRFEADFSGLDAPNGVFALVFGEFLGQLWTTYDDFGTSGNARFTANQKTQIAANQFLHATMSVTAISTQRRFPQLIISDQSAPVSDGFSDPNNNTVIFQTTGGPAMELQLYAFHGLVNGAAWGISNAGYHHMLAHAVSGNLDPLPQPGEEAIEPPFEHVGVDRMTKFDVYLSSSRFYLWMDDTPVACSLLPTEVVFSGPLTVTFGDEFFDESAGDEVVCGDHRPFNFLSRHSCVETSRHYDDLGFKSGAALPAWDEAKFPCKPF